MVYTIPFTSIFIYWLVSISSRAWFFLRFWKSIIANFVAIYQKRIYILSSRCVNRSLTGIGLDTNLPPLIFIFTIFEHMCLNNFSDDSNSPLKKLKLMVFEVFMFHENTELIPSGESHELSMGDNYPTERIKLVLSFRRGCSTATSDRQ